MPTSKPTLAKRVAELERQLEEMRNLVAQQATAPALQAAPAKAKAAAAAVGTATAASPAPVVVQLKPVGTAAVKNDDVQQEISHEVLAVIAAAVAHFIGKGARIRSARLVHPAGNSPWAQQGRVFVQASHNLAMTR